ncbi:MAG: hypothetical protein COB93_03375 [Sneathiella sp.]|nr:MAG: hypothetical protein COB93_03375 [Sneathiella sp.]
MRERELLAQNQSLREKNKRLSDAILTLVDHIENKLPRLESPTSFTSAQRTRKDRAAAEKIFQSDPELKTPPAPEVEIFETYPEPIEFAEPAPQMHFGARKDCQAQSSRPEPAAPPPEYTVSPELAPEEIDLLKSPTRAWSRGAKSTRETAHVVDLKPRADAAVGSDEIYEAGDVSTSEIPSFEFEDEEPVIDIEFQRQESMRAAMRRRVNRLRW